MIKLDFQFPDANSYLAVATEAVSGPESLRQDELAIAIALTQVDNKAQVANVLEGIVGAPLTANVLKLASEPVTRSEFLTQLLMALGGGSDLATVVNDLMPEGVSSTLVGTVTRPEPALEQLEIDGRLMSLVVGPINALPEAQRTVKGRVRSGEEIARAIPDVEAFFAAMSEREEGKFFELNDEGQLVMADGCPEAYGSGVDFPQAKMRQTCIWYLDEQGETRSMRDEALYTVRGADGVEFGIVCPVTVLELTEAAKKVVPIMQSGLPTLKSRCTGEYVRMNTGQLERSSSTWVDDDSLNHHRARFASFNVDGYVVSSVIGSYSLVSRLGSRGVLRVNLNLEV